MAGVKGRSGPKQEKPWRDALMVAAIGKTPEGKVKLRVIAERCVAAAMAGDMSAIIEIGNRLDGKPRQELEHSGDAAASFVVRMPDVVLDAERWARDYMPKTIQ